MNAPCSSSSEKAGAESVSAESCVNVLDTGSDEEVASLFMSSDEREIERGYGG